MTSNISLPPIIRFESITFPSYTVVYFKDISEILDTIGTSKTLLIQDCEEAYTLLGSLLLMNQGVKYELLGESTELQSDKEYIFVIQDGRYVYYAGDRTYHLRGKHVQQSP